MPGGAGVPGGAGAKGAGALGAGGGFGGGAAGSGGAPQNPQSQSGTAEFAAESIVVQILKGEASGLADFISPKCKGVLGANEAIFPELIQHNATAENIARAALDLLNDPQRRDAIRAKLTKVVESLGGPGASQRAAQAIVQLL